MGKQNAREQANLAEFVAAHGGRAYTGVPLSGPALGWPPNSPVHHVDAVWFETREPGAVVPWTEASSSEFATLVASRPAVLVSPRGYADRTAFGMLLA